MHVNPSEIKSYANQVIRKYNLSYPLNIRSFVTTLGFEVKYVDTGNCDAYTIIVNGRKSILLNQQIRSQTRINYIRIMQLIAPQLSIMGCCGCSLKANPDAK
jgi:hypothetical protein